MTTVSVQVRPGHVVALSSRLGAAAEPMAEAELVKGVQAREPRALSELHRRFAQPVLRILRRILGPDLELEDLHHDVFVRALRTIGGLRDPAALAGWMYAVAVHTAHAAIERRVRRRRWMFLTAHGEMPEAAPTLPQQNLEARASLRAAYAVLERMPTQERIVFALRFVDGMELSEIASACQISLATAKRRLARAEQRFVTLARHAPALATYVKGDG